MDIGATVGVGRDVGVIDMETAVGFGVDVDTDDIWPARGPTEGGRAVGAMGATGALEAYSRLAYSLSESIASGRFPGNIFASGSLSRASTSLTRTG